MLRSLRSAAATLILAVLVAGCGSSAPAGSSGATTDGTVAAALPGVTGAFGTRPTVTLPSPTPGGYSATVLIKGKGKPVAKGDLLVAHYLGETWRDGTVFDQSYERGSPATFGIGVAQVVPGWDQGLVGKRIGSRVVLVLPPDKAYGPSGNAQAGIRGSDTLVFVVDIVNAFGASAGAKGTPVAPVRGLPAVAIGPTGKPAITIPHGVAAPKKLVAQPLLAGSGAPVKKGQTVIAQYVGVIYGSGKQFDASRERGRPASFPIGVGRVIPGWDKALVGAKIGSRMLLVIPPEDGYGRQGNPQAGIRGTDTLVFVVDILDAVG